MSTTLIPTPSSAVTGGIPTTPSPVDGLRDLLEASHITDQNRTTLAAVESVCKTVDETLIPSHSYAPISQLPIEVFKRILLALSRGQSDRPLQNLNSPSLVARRWHQIILDTPELWATIDNRLPIKIIKVLLARSKNAPLHIQFQDQCSPAFRDLVMEHSSRWGSLVMLDPSDWNRRREPDEIGYVPFRSTLEKSAPTLHRLVLKNSKGAHLQLDEGQPLRHLELSGLSVNWDSSRLNGLRTLKLSSLIGLSTEVLLQLLTSSPQLESLSLTDLSKRLNTTPDDAIPTGLIHLPNLGSLELSSLEQYRSFAYRLCCPRCTFVRVDDLVDDYVLNKELTPGLVRLPASSKRPTTIVSVRSRDGMRHINVEEVGNYIKSSCSISLKVRDIEPTWNPETFVDFISALANTIPICMEVDLRTEPQWPAMPTVSPDAVLAFIQSLSTLPTLRKIGLIGYHACVSLTRYLATPIRDAATAEKNWPNPALRRIEMTYAECRSAEETAAHADELRNLILKRWGDTRAEDDQKSVVLILGSGFDPAVAEELEGSACDMDIAIRMRGPRV